jgi:peptide chain release factor 2
MMMQEAATMRIPKSNEELLAECEVETFRSSGPGGQNVNRRETAVRLRHLPSGIVVTCQQERSQLRNRRIALAELRSRLEELARPVRKRVPTAVPRSVRRRVLEAKRRRGRTKEVRKKPDIDD